MATGPRWSFSETAKLVLFVNAVGQFVLFFDGVFSSYAGGGVRQLELPQRGVGVLVASDETDAAAGGATSISFSLEFAAASRSAEIYLVDNIGRVPGFYDQTYKKKVGLQLRRRSSTGPGNVTLTAYYQWPSANIRGWSEGSASAGDIFGKSIWIDIAIDRQSHPDPLPAVQVFDSGRQIAIFKANFNGRSDYSLRPKVEYRVISDLPFSVGNVLSFIGQDTARRWADDYARNFTTPSPPVPTIHISGSEVAPTIANFFTSTPTEPGEFVTQGKIIIQFPEYNDSPPSEGEDRMATMPPHGAVTNSAGSNRVAVPSYETWLPPPTWLLITSGCLLFFLFIVFIGTVLYLCSRRPGFIFVTEEDNNNNNNNNITNSASNTPRFRLSHHSGSKKTGNNGDDGDGSSPSSMTPSPVTRRRCPPMIDDNDQGAMNHSTSPMMSDSPDEDLPESPKLPPPVNSYRAASSATTSTTAAASKSYKPAVAPRNNNALMVTYADEITEEDDIIITSESEQLPRGHTHSILKFGPSSKR